ncbi:hypothetical protein HJC23_012775 [Cyclotella cryptica]|uniref:Fe2OG dioxygenase domain-containing protein n=1 Tax=Cyclotella cryptica TaxID=29204 RepID=A0ABD3Q3J7_9STRA|eukprot:CCRYP_008984-RA/>CCRYP_008984-RA protein AED:0.44 eAED:0.44 QI:0/-1/0/1/-1/1/1/0/279
MINYSKYPIHNQTDKSPDYDALVQLCKDQIRRQGFVCLKSFLESSFVDHLISSVLDLEKQGVGFYSTERHNIFLEENSSTPTEEHSNISSHPRNIQLKSSKILINAKDLSSHATDLDNLFQSRALLHFISDVLEMKLYTSTDECGKYYANIFHEGDGLNWHFDRSEFSISLILQPAEEGGMFQFVPNSREMVEGWSEMPLDMNDFTASLGTSQRSKLMVLQEPELASGDLYLFRGQKSLHRVSEVVKGKRINVILTFNTETDVVLNKYTLKKFFGVEGS